MEADALKWILEESEAYLADGLGKAIIGTAEVAGRGTVAAYDVDKVRQVLIEDQEMTEEEAEEWLGYNILGAFVGPGTPVFIQRLYDGEDCTEWHP